MAEPSKNKVLLFNPRSATRNHRLPVSLLQIAASVAGTHEVAFVDGNLEPDPWKKIAHLMDSGDFRYFGVTVMPGPQLKQAIPLTRKVHAGYPGVKTIWGGYFPSLHPEPAVRSGYVDFVIRGCGDRAFPELLQHLDQQSDVPPYGVPNLVYLDPSKNLVTTTCETIPEEGQDLSYPFHLLHKSYSVERYIPKTWIGSRTISLHTSFGCPHICSFCGVASVFGGTWKGASPDRVHQQILALKEQYGVNAVEFLDSNFFASKSRVLELCRLMKDDQIRWWAEGRVDTLNSFTDEELALLKQAGCSLVFMGAESGSDDILRGWNKGGSLTITSTEEVVARFRNVGIIPELSMVLGLPAASPREVWASIRRDIAFVRKLKRINPGTEFVLYLYSPVPGDRPEEQSFRWPLNLEDWLDPALEQLDLRKDPPVPWLRPFMSRHVKDFDVVMHAAFPVKSDVQIRGLKKILITIPGRLRYLLRWYRYPLELKALLKWIRYQQPELEGFRAE